MLPLINKVDFDDDDDDGKDDDDDDDDDFTLGKKLHSNNKEYAWEGTTLTNTAF